MKTSCFLTPTESRSEPRPLPTKARSELRSLILAGLSALAIFLSAPAGVRATTIGTQAFNAAGEPIHLNMGGDVTTATVFHFAEFASTTNQTGIFAGMPIQMFGPTNLLVKHSTGLDFGNSVFGNFTSTSITETTGPNLANFIVDGMWTPGTFSGFSGLTGSFDADMILSFTQVGGPRTAVSFSGTLAVSNGPSVVPEPSSIVLVLTGLIAGVVMFRFRRSQCNLVIG